MKLLKLKKKTVLLGLFIVLILTVLSVASFAGKSKDSSKLEGATSTSKQDTVTDGANNLKSTALDGELVKNLPKEVSAIPLLAVNGQSGWATAVAVSDGSQLAVAIEASLPDAGDKFYFAWFSKDSENNNLEALGRLEKKEGMYILPASVNGPISNYQKFVITLEINDDNKAETVVLEGQIKS